MCLNEELNCLLKVHVCFVLYIDYIVPLVGLFCRHWTYSVDEISPWKSLIRRHRFNFDTCMTTIPISFEQILTPSVFVCVWRGQSPPHTLRPSPRSDFQRNGTYINTEIYTNIFILIKFLNIDTTTWMLVHLFLPQGSMKSIWILLIICLFW